MSLDVEPDTLKHLFICCRSFHCLICIPLTTKQLTMQVQYNQPVPSADRARLRQTKLPLSLWLDVNVVVTLLPGGVSDLFRMYIS